MSCLVYGRNRGSTSFKNPVTRSDRQEPGLRPIVIQCRLAGLHFTSSCNVTCRSVHGCALPPYVLY